MQKLQKRLFIFLFAIVAGILLLVEGITVSQGEFEGTFARILVLVLLVGTPFLAFRYTSGRPWLKYMAAALAFLVVDFSAAYLVPLQENMATVDIWPYLAIMILGGSVATYAYRWYQKR